VFKKLPVSFSGFWADFILFFEIVKIPADEGYQAFLLHMQLALLSFLYLFHFCQQSFQPN
jgi:hypothetical protein